MRRTQSSFSGFSAEESQSQQERIESSPRLTAEAKKLAARIKREEDQNHVRISAFNKQLMDMIRQGKEALGTKVEVEGDGADVEDGRWEDEDVC